MGTRGAMGVRINGEDKIGYCQFDSYPEGRPKKMVSDLRKSLPALRDKAATLRVVSRDYAPTDEDRKRLGKYADTGVAGQSLDDIYCLLRETHGDLAATLKAGMVTDNRAFMADSLFCEFAYIANFDDNLFEVYRGFQRHKHDKGRYADMPRVKEDGDYWPVALVAAFPIDNIPKDWAKLAFPPGEEDE